MNSQSLRVLAAAALGAALAQPVFAGNLLTNGNFDDFLGSFGANGSITTNATTWDKWRVWGGFTSVNDGTLQEPTVGTTPFPDGWTGANFAQHWITASQWDVTDQLKQGIDGSEIQAGKPVKLSFQYINTEEGRAPIVEVYGIDGTQYWSEFAPWDCSGCTLLYRKEITPTWPSPQVWTTFTDSFTPAASHAVVAIGIQLGGHYGYARGIDNVTLTQNEPPVCTDASPSVARVWPPNHSMVPITILGVTDPDGDSITISVTSIYQDEPVNGLGDGDTSPDGSGIGTATAKVRAERGGSGNGRVYHVSFTASDGNGGACNGAVLVSVPKSQDPRRPAIDGGALFDSTTP